MSAAAGPGAPLALVSGLGDAEGSRAAAAALACAGAAVDLATLFVDVGGRPPRPTLLAAAPARRLEERLVIHLPGLGVAARGEFCQLAVPGDADGFAAAAAAATVARDGLAVVHLPAALLREALAAKLGGQATGVLLRADPAASRPLLALVARDLIARGLTVAVLKRRLAWVAERRALFGALSADAPGGLPGPLRERLLARKWPPTNERLPGSEQLLAPGAVEHGL